MLNGLAQNLNFYLCFSAILFSLGAVAVLSRRNVIGLFLGVELMLNAAAINFIAFQAFKKIPPGADTTLHGHIFSLFIIVIAAIEAAIALAIVLRVFAVRNDINPDNLTELKG